MKRLFLLTLSFLCLPTLVHADVVLSGGGLALMEQGGTFAANNLAGTSAGGIPFSSSDLGPELGIGFHVAANLNDETYGNSNSWIGGGTNPFPAPFAGVALDGAFTLRSIAFGRDNLNMFGDRALGPYTLQYTTVAGPSASTPDASWTTIGMLDYQSPGGGNFSVPHLRHRYNFDPVANVTGVRLLVPGTGVGGGTAIDEIELYEMAGPFVPPPPPPPNLVISPAAGFAIGFDGNNGVHSTPNNPAPVPNNLALASQGAIPFSSSDLGPQLSIPFHIAANLNDGEYGNSHSWIGGDANPFPAPFAGVSLDGLFYVDEIAWGRDNGNIAGDTGCGGGICPDRDTGLYTIQFTQVGGADQNTPETGNPATGWATVGTVDIQRDDPGVFDAHLRHEFEIGNSDGSPIVASALRLKVPSTGLGTGTAIDEIEIYGRPVPEPGTWALAAAALSLIALRCRLRRGKKE
jgi:hypothetical protein